MRANRVDARRIDFEENFYNGNDLGVNYSNGVILIRIWAPVADGVSFSLYKDQEDSFPIKVYDLERDVKGTWTKQIEGEYSDYYYLFQIHYGSRIEKTIGPYARAVGTNSKKGLIIDLKKTNPSGWEKDKRIKIENSLEVIIYELHVRDFSSSPNSGLNNKGMYLAFTEEGVVNSKGEKTGIEHLKELGITHVHLLPVYDFGSVSDKTREYNWGYDPYLYNVPEGSYSTNPSNGSRIVEFKKMVKALHNNGIGVIIDVVYNHTYSCEGSVFQKIAPNYFYRFVNDHFANGSGCGNEIATERPMVRKFIIDSVCYWAEEYHIDGFRFDLMGLIDKETMQKIRERLSEISSSILIYGEPWTALETPLDWKKQMRKGAQKGTKIAVFNNNFRDTIKDFLLGFDSNIEDLKRGLVGAIEYNNVICDFAYRSEECINYVGCHDNLTLWDDINSNCPHLSETEKIKLHRLAQLIVFTSQGIPFVQGGVEFLRTKYFNDNSYNAGDHCNQLKWTRKSKFKETFNYCKGLIQLRKEHSAFKIYDSEIIRTSLQFIDIPKKALGFKLINHANNDKWEEIYVFYNFENDWVQFDLEEEKRLGIVVDKKRAGVKMFNEFKADNVRVPPLSGMVLKLIKSNQE